MHALAVAESRRGAGRRCIVAGRVKILPAYGARGLEQVGHVFRSQSARDIGVFSHSLDPYVEVMVRGAAWRYKRRSRSDAMLADAASSTGGHAGRACLRLAQPCAAWECPSN
jgi:hypothetical protein